MLIRENISFSLWKKERINHIEKIISKILPENSISLHKAMHYAVLNGGKRIRSLLVYASAYACSKFVEKQEKWHNDSIDRIAASIEIIHSYSLIHDDLPCIDNDNFRRGLLSTHIKFNEALALLAGDALQALAFNTLSNMSIPDKNIVVESIKLVSHAIGSFGMVGGQSIDIENAGKNMSYEDIKNMHIMKTGALISCSIMLPCIIYNLNDEIKKIFKDYANILGLIFQIKDDILDKDIDSNYLDKTNTKPNYVSLLGMEKTHEHITNLLNEANNIIIPLNQYGSRLSEIANFILTRNE